MIWKFDHVETLTWEEYDYWMTHRLPFGWSILSKPREVNTRARDLDRS
jgi:hypothetical protein